MALLEPTLTDPDKSCPSEASPWFLWKCIQGTRIDKQIQKKRFGQRKIERNCVSKVSLGSDGHQMVLWSRHVQECNWSSWPTRQSTGLPCQCHEMVFRLVSEQCRHKKNSIVCWSSGAPRRKNWYTGCRQSVHNSVGLPVHQRNPLAH